MIQKIIEFSAELKVEAFRGKGEILDYGGIEKEKSRLSDAFRGRVPLNGPFTEISQAKGAALALHSCVTGS